MNFLIFLFVFLFGLIIGSFLNCLVWRLYNEETLWGRSYCPKCRKQITWYDNIPLVSFFLLGGKCRYCRQKISWQYPIVEFLTAALFTLASAKVYQAGGVISEFGQLIFTPGQILSLAKDWLAIAVMTAVFIYDARWYLISTGLIIGAAVLFLGFDLALGVNWWSLTAAFAIGIGFFLIQYLLTGGRGLGEGDIWLGGLMGLIFPSVGLLLTALFLSYISGGLTGVFLLITKKSGLKSKLPLGVFLALGVILTIFWGQNLLSWYLGVLHR